MADEATVNASVAYVNGDDNISFGKSGLTIDVSGTEYIKMKQLVSTSEEVLIFGDVAKGGLGVFYNGHATAIIQIRADTAETDLVRLEPGDVALFRIDDGATPYVISSVEGAGLDYMIIDP